MNAEYRTVPLDLIHVLPRRIRAAATEADLAPLVDSLHRGDTHLPLVVCTRDEYPGKFLLAEGYRRLEAYKLLDDPEVPALVLHGVNPLDIEQAEFRRKNYTDLQLWQEAQLRLEDEEVEAIIRMRQGTPVPNEDRGRSSEKVARLTGMGKSNIQKLIEIRNSGEITHDEKQVLYAEMNKPRRVNAVHKRFRRLVVQKQAERSRTPNPPGFPDNSFHLGDALELLKQMPNSYADAVVTDPPFGIGKQYGDWKEPDSPDAYREWFLPHHEQIVRVLRPGGVLFMWQALKYHRHFWEWYGDDIRTFYCCKTGATSTGDWLHERVDPAVIWVKPGAPRLVAARPVDTNNWAEVDVGDVPELAKTHPYAKPASLCERIIGTFVVEGGRLIDPFCGSGMICVSARRTGRTFVGIEKEPAHVHVARELLAQCDDELTPQEADDLLRRIAQKAA